MTKLRTYHGWILVEDGGKDYVSVEWFENGNRHNEAIGHGESGSAQAVEWWETKLGRPVLLQPTLRGCYRVYTECFRRCPDLARGRR